MATAIKQRELLKELPVSNSYFGGNYARIDKYSSTLPAPQTQKLLSAAQSFNAELQKILKQNPYALVKRLQSPAKVHNISNVLPLTGAVGEKIGTQGLIYMGSVLKYCAYYKRSAPAPRFM